MSLEYAILGFLNYGPASGYDLKKKFDLSVRHFWSADQSQIYRTLARLADRGWAEIELVEQQERPDRKLYHLTAAGREALRRWLTTPLPPHEPRSAPLIQVFFAGQLSDEEALANFRREAGQLRHLLAQYDQIPGAIEDYVEVVDSARETFFWMVTLECGIKMARAQLEWLESVISRIENKEHPPLEDPSSNRRNT